MNYPILLLASLMAVLSFGINEACFQKVSRQSLIRFTFVVIIGLLYASALFALSMDRSILSSAIAAEVAMTALIPLFHFGYRIVVLSRSNGTR